MPSIIYLASVALLASVTSGGGKKKCREPNSWVRYHDNFQSAATGWQADVYCNTLKLETSCRFNSDTKINAAELSYDEILVYPLAPKYTLKCETDPITHEQLIPSVILTATVPCKSADSWQPYEKFIAFDSGVTAEVFCDADKQQTKCRFLRKGGLDKDKPSTFGTGEQDICVVGFTCGCHKEGAGAIPWMANAELNQAPKKQLSSKLSQGKDKSH